MTSRHQMNNFSQSVKYHLEGKVALITGASRGIGAATAQLFAQEGATVVLASRSEEELARIVEEIRANGGEVMAATTDVAEAASVEILIKRTVDTYGRLDIAVNNPGIAGGNKPLVEVTEEVFGRVIPANPKCDFLAINTNIPPT